MISDALYLHLFNRVLNWGPLRLAKIYQHFENGQKAFSANKNQLIHAGIEAEKAEAFFKVREEISPEAELNRLTKEGIYLLTLSDPNYPNLLKEIFQPPPLLYYKGALGPPDELSIAVVGTRKITNYGRVIIPQLITPLIKEGITIVSGLAYGIDAAAHEVAVKEGRRTVAVMGCGLDEKSLYPQNHVYLADQIIRAGGVLISEYPPTTPALRHNFIARNRILSGLAIGTLVVECNLKSGSLITAKYALEQNRTVYAVPGQIYSESSKGPNNLIKMGAKLITSSQDILDDLNILPKPTTKKIPSFTADTPAESALLKLLSSQPITIHELIKKSGLSASLTTSTLTFLELKGNVRNIGGQQYIV